VNLDDWTGSPQPGEPEQPAVDWKGESVSPLPEDWTFGTLTPEEQRIIDAFRSLETCTEPNCQIKDKKVRASVFTRDILQALGTICMVAEEMYRHGDHLAGERLALIANRIIPEVLHPYAISAGWGKE
jgi:hypothetical protein